MWELFITVCQGSERAELDQYADVSSVLGAISCRSVPRQLSAGHSWPKCVTAHVACQKRPVSETH